MATQQPPRPWFRLASMMRPTTPARPPPPPPLPPFRPPLALPQEPPRPPPLAATSPPPPQVTAPPSPPPLPQFRPPQALPQEPPRPQPPAATSPPLPQATALPSPPGPMQIPASLSSPIASPPSAPKSPVAAPPAIASATVASPKSPAASSTSAPSPKQNSSAVPLSPPPRALLPSGAPPPPSVPAPPPPSPFKPPPSAITPPKVVKQWEGRSPPDQSPIPKSLSHPPSPLTLPAPAQLKPDDSNRLEPIPAEAKQKTVVMHDKPSITDQHASYDTGHLHLQKNNKSGGFRDENLAVAENVKGEATKMKKPSPKSSSGMRLVTLAGDNKGAVMEVSISSPSRKKFAQKLDGSAKINDDMISKKKEGEEGYEKGNKGSMKMGPMDAFVNSNVQGVNNSIVYNCSYTNRNPGVHLYVSRNGGGGRGAHLIKDPAALPD